MGFTCDNELRVIGGAAEERRRALSIALAADCVSAPAAEAAEAVEAALEDAPGTAARAAATARFATVDGLPEAAVLDLARSFPELGFSLLYLSLDGGFMGALAARGERSASDSADLDDSDRAAIDRLHALDPLGYARERFADVAASAEA